MMEARRIVSNTGPLISLEKLHRGHDFIRQLYDTIIIPPGVLDEVAEGQFATPHAYLQHYGIVDLIEVHAVSRSERLPEAARLHVGEVQAIQLALELAHPLLIEETVGRRVAQGMGISISGVAGQVLKAFRPTKHAEGERSAMTTRVATRRIDVDTHFYPPVDYKALREYLPRGLLAQAQDMLVRDAMRAAEPDRVAAETSGAAPPSLHGSDPHRDPDARAAAMEKTGFDMQVLIPDSLFANLYGASPSSGDLSLPIRTALCKLYNDAVANAQRRYPDRFIGPANIPFDDLEASILEARRAVRDLGLRAVLIPGNWMGKNFDTLELYPFWGALHELDVTVFVHHIPQGCRGRPTIDHQPRYPMLGMERMRRLHIGTYLGFGLEYIMACAALTLGGVLDEFPHLRFCFFEAGASWMPYAMYGADRSFEIEPQCARTTTLPSQLIKRHCLTAVEPAEHLEQLVEAIGSEHFFFGTDFPHPEFRRYHNTAAALLDRPGLSREAKDNILGNNIARCLRLG